MRHMGCGEVGDETGDAGWLGVLFCLEIRSRKRGKRRSHKVPRAGRPCMSVPGMRSGNDVGGALGRLDLALAFQVDQCLIQIVGDHTTIGQRGFDICRGMSFFV